MSTENLSFLPYRGLKTAEAGRGQAPVIFQQKMLTQQLRTLEQHGIVHRKIYPEAPVVVEYSLTGIDQKLLPILKKLNGWAVEYLSNRPGSSPE